MRKTIKHCTFEPGDRQCRDSWQQRERRTQSSAPDCPSPPPWATRFRLLTVVSPGTGPPRLVRISASLITECPAVFQPLALERQPLPWWGCHLHVLLKLCSSTTIHSFQVRFPQAPLPAFSSSLYFLAVMPTFTLLGRGWKAEKDTFKACIT